MIINRQPNPAIPEPTGQYGQALDLLEQLHAIMSDMDIRSPTKQDLTLAHVNGRMLEEMSHGVIRLWELKWRETATRPPQPMLIPRTVH